MGGGVGCAPNCVDDDAAATAAAVDCRTAGVCVASSTKAGRCGWVVVVVAGGALATDHAEDATEFEEDQQEEGTGRGLLREEKENDDDEVGEWGCIVQ